MKTRSLLCFALASLLGIVLTVTLSAQQVHTTMFPMLSQNGPPTDAYPGAGMLDFDRLSHTLYGCSIAGGLPPRVNVQAASRPENQLQTAPTI